jgi:hypothetical protein
MPRFRYVVPFICFHRSWRVSKTRSPQCRSRRGVTNSMLEVSVDCVFNGLSFICEPFSCLSTILFFSQIKIHVHFNVKSHVFSDFHCSHLQVHCSIDRWKMTDSESDGDFDRASLVRDVWMRFLDSPKSRAIVDGSEWTGVSDAMGKLLIVCLSDHMAKQKGTFNRVLDLATKLRRKNNSLSKELNDFTLGALKFGYGAFVKVEPVDEGSGVVVSNCNIFFYYFILHWHVF